MNGTTCMIAIVGPSGVGKTTMVRVVLNEFGFTFALSCTTRDRRSNEIEGVSYEYIGHGEFRRRIDDEELFEYTQYNEQYYGTPLHLVMNALATGSPLIFDINVDGCKVFQNDPRTRDHFKTIFLMPKSIEALRAQLEGRNDLPPSKIDARIKEAEREMQMARDGAFDFVVVNNDIEITKAEVCRIVAELTGRSIAA